MSFFKIITYIPSTKDTIFSSLARTGAFLSKSNRSSPDQSNLRSAILSCTECQAECQLIQSTTPQPISYSRSEEPTQVTISLSHQASCCFSTSSALYSNSTPEQQGNTNIDAAENTPPAERRKNIEFVSMHMAYLPAEQLHLVRVPNPAQELELLPLPTLFDVGSDAFLPPIKLGAPEPAVGRTRAEHRASVLWFFMHPPSQSGQPRALSRAATRAEVQPQLREVHFDRESMNDQIEREAAEMRAGDRRLSSFERIETTTSRHGISKSELLALAHIGMYLCSDYTASTSGPLHLKLRCSFCRHSFRYRVTGIEPENRLVRLRLEHALEAHTCPINLGHPADDLDLGRDQLTRSLSGGDPFNLCNIPHVEMQQVVQDLRLSWTPLQPSLDDGRVYEQSASLEYEWFGRAFTSPEQWPDFEPEDLNERAVYEKAPLSLLDYQSAVAASRPEHTSRESRLDTFYEIVQVEQSPAHIRDRRERRQRWPHQEPNPEQLASAGFFYNGTGDGATCFWCGNTLTTWYQEDQAMSSHARIVPNCPFVLRCTSRYFVRDIIQRESPSQQRDLLLADWRPVIDLTPLTPGQGVAIPLPTVDPRAVRARQDTEVAVFMLGLFDLPKSLIGCALELRLARHKGEESQSMMNVLEAVWEMLVQARQQGITDYNVYCARLLGPRPSTAAVAPLTTTTTTAPPTIAPLESTLSLSYTASIADTSTTGSSGYGGSSGSRDSDYLSLGSTISSIRSSAAGQSSLEGTQSSNASITTSRSTGPGNESSISGGSLGTSSSNSSTGRGVGAGSFPSHIGDSRAGSSREGSSLRNPGVNESLQQSLSSTRTGPGQSPSRIRTAPGQSPASIRTAPGPDSNYSLSASTGTWSSNSSSETGVSGGVSGGRNISGVQSYSGIGPPGGGGVTEGSSDPGRTGTAPARTDPRGICRVCGERPSNGLLLPCGHLVVCQVCGERTTLCPVCTAPIHSWIVTYLS